MWPTRKITSAQFVMHFFSRSTFLSIVATVATVRAQTTPPAPAADSAASTVVLDRFVVSEKLDKAREDIVPSLGAAEFHIDRAQLEAQALGFNAGFNEVLLRAPGVAQDSFGQVHVRGEHGDLQYRINDVPLPEGLTGFGQELDTRFADSVNVLTGALPAQYGYRTAGVVDIHTRGTARPGGEITVHGGSFDTLGASAEVTAARGQSGAYVTTSAERNALGVENPTSSRTAIHDRKTQLKSFGYFSYVLDDTSRLNLMLSVSFAWFQIPNNPGQEPAFTLAGVPVFDSTQLDENQREENHYGIVAYQKSTGDLSLQVSAFTRYSLVAFAPDRNGDLIFNGVASRVRRNLVGNGLEADAKWPVGASHTLRAGVVATSSNAGARTTTSVFATTANGDQASSTPFDIADNQRKLGWLDGAYVQDEWKPTKEFTLNYGLRADASHGYVEEGQLSPRVNLVYQPTSDIGAHAGYARYFTPPPLELVQNGTIGKFSGTTNAPEIAVSSPVRSERADYFDAGLSAKLTSDLTVNLDAYDKRATNLLDEGQFGQALITSPFNYRRGHIYGVEISGNYSHRGFSAYANAAFSRAKGRELVSGEFLFGAEERDYISGHYVHLDHDQIYTASAGVSYRFGATLVCADILYGSGLRRGSANTAHVPEYHPVNAGIAHTFKLAAHREVRARVDVANVFDEVYPLRDGSGIGVGAPQFGARRGIYGTLTLAF
jgi:outer membrane receptor protein involved in Fe transport